MVRATTPTFIIVLPDTFDLTAADQVFATLRQNELKITKTGSALAVEEHKAIFSLSQAESLKYNALYGAELQLNWVYSDGSRGCTNIIPINVGRNLEPEVLP